MKRSRGCPVTRLGLGLGLCAVLRVSSLFLFFSLPPRYGLGATGLHSPIGLMVEGRLTGLFCVECRCLGVRIRTGVCVCVCVWLGGLTG